MVVPIGGAPPAAPGVAGPSGASYTMIKTLGLEHFRCFKEASLHNLKRFNIIVGDNASGKTTLLEAMFVASGGSPELLFRTKGWRGVVASVTSGGTGLDVFRDAFFNFDVTRSAKVWFDDSRQLTRRTLVISSGQEVSFLVPVDGVPAAIESPVSFQWSEGNKVIHESKLKITDDGQAIFPATHQVYQAILLTLGAGPLDHQQRFSDLSKVKRTDEVVAAVRNVFPMVKGLSLEFDGVRTSIYADVEGLAHKLPIGLLSFGISRFLAALLAVLDRPRGVVLIDELDAGIFHERQRAMMEALIDAGDQTQIFLTTHSQEFLRSIAPVIAANEDDCALIRLRRHDGQCVPRVIDGGDFAAALSEDLEVR